VLRALTRFQLAMAREVWAGTSKATSQSPLARPCRSGWEVSRLLEALATTAEVMLEMPQVLRVVEVELPTFAARRTRCSTVSSSALEAAEDRTQG